MHRRSSLSAAALAATVLLVGCGADAVSVTPAPNHANPLCAKVARHWPTTVSGEKKRAVSTADGTEAAWGDPAIIARCGVPSPGPNTDCVNVSGVDWVLNELSDGVSLVTFGRDPAIQVLVPKHYDSGAFVLGAFGAAASQIPQGGRHCS